MINEIQPKIKFQNIVQCPFNEDNKDIKYNTISNERESGNPPKNELSLFLIFVQTFIAKWQHER